MDFLNFFLKRADEHSFKSMDGLIHVAKVYANLNDKQVNSSKRILKKDPNSVKNLNLCKTYIALVILRQQVFN